MNRVLLYTPGTTPVAPESVVAASRPRRLPEKQPGTRHHMTASTSTDTMRAAGQKRRIHDKPSRTEVVACRPWLLAELDAVAPRIVVCLGATAAQALLGSKFRLTQHRGELFNLADDGDVGPERAQDVIATVHPSSILRGPSDKRDKAFDDFVADLRVVSNLLAS